VRQIFNLVKIGNYPEVVCKALGIRYAVFVAWTKRGLSDLLEEKDSIFAMFVAAVDAGVAQDEIASLSLITRRVNNWQALAWKLERARFKRWGQRTAIGVGSLEEMKDQAEQSKMPFDKLGEVLAIMEQAGVLPVPPKEITSPETLEGNIIEVTADPQEKPQTAEDEATTEATTTDEVDEAVDKVKEILREKLSVNQKGKPKDEDEDETAADALREDLGFTSDEEPRPKAKPKPVERHSTDTSRHLPGHSRLG